MTPQLYFPIVSCAGIDNPDAAPYHQQWLLVDESNGWIGANDCEQLAQIALEVRLGYLIMRAPGMLRMDIPLDVIEDDDSVRRQAHVGEQSIDVIDEGDLAAAWMSNFLKRPCRLVKIHPKDQVILWPAAR